MWPNRFVVGVTLAFADDIDVIIGVACGVDTDVFARVCVCIYRGTVPERDETSVGLFG